MALADDIFYGYVKWVLVSKRVTWLELACASICWSTILVCYLEEPFGHLMLEEVSVASARTKVRGNLFSFAMPWEDIEANCHIVMTGAANSSAGNKRGLQRIKRKCSQVPHDEVTLATLLNVHIVGGTTDLATHLEGATMRPAIVEELITALRSSGYPGYEEDGPNSADKVRERLTVMYKRPYGEEKFIPREIEVAMREAWRKQHGQVSLMQDKNATPSEPAGDVQTLYNTLRPLEIVAGRSSNSLSEAHNEHKSVFQRFKDMEVNTGSVMLDQHRPQYLGMTFLFSLPAAVGGIDIRGQDRWRRPSEEEVFLDPITSLVKPEQSFWPGFSAERQVAGTTVPIFAIT